MKKIHYPDETMMRYFIAAFLTGVLFSLLIIWYGKTYYLQKAGLISNFYLRRLKYRSWEKRELLGCFLGKRMKWVALFPVFFFGAGVHLPLFLAGGWFGFSFGMVMGISVLKFGFLGVGTGLLLVLPQGIFYAAGALVMLQGLAEWKWSFNRWTAFPGKKLMGSTVLFFLGILTESYLNPWNLRLLFLFL
ncbi:MAG: hypothetical protein ACLS5R_08115 [Blautia sp.]